MTGFDGGGWSRIASREAPTSENQRNTKVPTALTPMLLSPSLRNAVNVPVMA